MRPMLNLRAAAMRSALAVRIWYVNMLLDFLLSLFVQFRSKADLFKQLFGPMKHILEDVKNSPHLRGIAPIDGVIILLYQGAPLPAHRWLVRQVAVNVGCIELV